MRPLSMRISNIWSRILGLNDLSDAQSYSHKVSQGCLLSLACAAGLEGTKALPTVAALKLTRRFTGQAVAFHQSPPVATSHCSRVHAYDSGCSRRAGEAHREPRASRYTPAHRMLSASRYTPAHRELRASGYTPAHRELRASRYAPASRYTPAHREPLASRFFLLDLLAESSGRAGVYLLPGSSGQAGALGEQVRTCSLGAPGEQVCTCSLGAPGKQVCTCSPGAPSEHPFTCSPKALGEQVKQETSACSGLP
ncbi:hypothetical protein PCASD_26618, partial [Puccinia coronata f. sp. avenae]